MLSVAQIADGVAAVAVAERGAEQHRTNHRALHAAVTLPTRTTVRRLLGSRTPAIARPRGLRRSTTR